MIKHLHILSDAGLLELRQWLAFYERYWEGRLSALRRYVEREKP